MNVKDWIPPMAKTWAAQKRYIWFGVDGWPTTSILGKLREERDGASQQGKRVQHFAEVYRGDGLVIHRALFGCPELPAFVFHVHYLVHGVPIKDKSQGCGVSPAQYWMQLDNCYYYLAGRIDAQERPEGEKAV